MLYERIKIRKDGSGAVIETEAVDNPGPPEEIAVKEVSVDGLKMSIIGDGEVVLTGGFNGKCPFAADVEVDEACGVKIGYVTLA